MTTTDITTALEAVYAALHADNKDIDLHIATLRAALLAAGQKSVEMAPDRLAQNNRQGRKTLEAYFRKRGVVVTFASAA